MKSRIYIFIICYWALGIGLAGCKRNNPTPYRGLPKSYETAYQQIYGHCYDSLPNVAVVSLDLYSDVSKEQDTISIYPISSFQTACWNRVRIARTPPAKHLPSCPDASSKDTHSACIFSISRTIKYCISSCWIRVRSSIATTALLSHSIFATRTAPRQPIPVRSAGPSNHGKNSNIRYRSAARVPYVVTT